MLCGHKGTIHGTQHLNVEQDADGKVVSVWFRCCALPFDVTEVGYDRAVEMEAMTARINKESKLLAVEIEQQP